MNIFLLILVFYYCLTSSSTSSTPSTGLILLISGFILIEFEINQCIYHPVNYLSYNVHLVQINSINIPNLDKSNILCYDNYDKPIKEIDIKIFPSTFLQNNILINPKSLYLLFPSIPINYCIIPSLSIPLKCIDHIFTLHILNPRDSSISSSSHSFNQPQISSLSPFPNDYQEFINKNDPINHYLTLEDFPDFLSKPILTNLIEIEKSDIFPFFKKKTVKIPNKIEKSPKTTQEYIKIQHTPTSKKHQSYSSSPSGMAESSQSSINHANIHHHLSDVIKRGDPKDIDHDQGIRYVKEFEQFEGTGEDRHPVPDIYTSGQMDKVIKDTMILPSFADNHQFGAYKPQPYPRIKPGHKVVTPDEIPPYSPDEPTNKSPFPPGLGGGAEEQDEKNNEKVDLDNPFESWCDLEDPFGNPFCPIPSLYMIMTNILIKVMVPGLIGPLIDTWVESYMRGQQTPLDVWAAVMIQLDQDIRNSSNSVHSISIPNTNSFTSLMERREEDESFRKRFFKEYPQYDYQIHKRHPLAEMVSQRARIYYDKSNPSSYHLLSNIKNSVSIILKGKDNPSSSFLETKTTDPFAKKSDESEFSATPGPGKILLPMIENALFQALVHPIGMSIAWGTTVKFSEMVIPPLHDMLERNLKEFLSSSLSHSLLHVLGAGLPLTVGTAVEDVISRILPSRIMNNLLYSISHTLTRSLTHSISDTLIESLGQTPLSRYYCYYCKHFKSFCQQCRQSTQFDPNFAHSYGYHYASFYSDYYSHYINPKPKSNS